MKKRQMNWQIRWGLVINAVSMVGIRFFNMNNLLSCFLMGVGIALIFFGIIVSNRDMSKIKKFKKGLFKNL